MKHREQEEERQLKKLVQVLNNRGIAVRRENLSRGSAFRVKSGGCLFSGENIVFLDRRLSISQQLAVLVDHILDLDMQLLPAESEGLSKQTLALLAGAALAEVA